MTRLRHSWAALALGSLLALGCHPKSTPPDAGPTPECETRDDCDGGLVCTKDKFCSTCTSSGQCRLKELCDPKTQLCEFRPGWGNQCQQNADCQAGQWCAQGLCQDRANVYLCPDGINSECPQGDRCNTINLVCEANLGCIENGDCDPGEVCNTGSHACEQACTAADQSSVCAAGQQCVNSLCVQCTQNSDCGVGLVCDPAGNCSSGAICYSDRDCNIPLICYVLTGQCVPQLPPCVSDENCATDQRCDIGTGQCIPRTCQPDRLEPNGTQAQAFGVAPGQYQSLTLCNNETDWFSLPLTRGDQLGVNVDADPYAEQTFTTTLRDSTGRVLASGHLLASWVAAEPDTYYVTVSSTDPYENYGINFLLSRGTPCNDESNEANNTPQTATALNSTTSVDGVICPQDIDWFSVNVPADAGVSVSLTNYNSINGLLQLCLFPGMSPDAGSADAGTPFGCSEDTNAPTVSAPAAAVGGGSVLVLVQGSTSSIANAYTLQVVFQ